MLAESSGCGECGRIPRFPLIEEAAGAGCNRAKRDGVSESRQVRNLVAVLIDHRRIHFLDPIIRQLEKELDARLGFAEAEITSARELGAAEKAARVQALSRKAGPAESAGRDSVRMRRFWEARWSAWAARFTMVR